MSNFDEINKPYTEKLDFVEEYDNTTDKNIDFKDLFDGPLNDDNFSNSSDDDDNIKIADDDITDDAEEKEKNRLTEELLLKMIDDNQLNDLYNWLVKNENYSNKRVMNHQLPNEYWILKNLPEKYTPAREIRTFIKKGGPELWQRINSFDVKWIKHWIDTHEEDLAITHPLSGNTIFHENISFENICDVSMGVLSMLNHESNPAKFYNREDEKELFRKIDESNKKFEEILKTEQTRDEKMFQNNAEIFNLTKQLKK